MKGILLLVSHLLVGLMGFGIGIYTLPILIQPASPPADEIQSIIQKAAYSGTFSKDRQGSDILHWGEGYVALSDTHLAFIGELAPGPDYKAYLSPVFVETEADFKANKDKMLLVGEVKTFKRFSLTLPESTNINSYNTVVVWCESFGRFITSAHIR